MRRGVLLLLLCAPLLAQVYEPKRCVYREGDDPAWARPDFDDSDWTTKAPDPTSTVPASPYLWQRCRFQIPRPASTGSLFVQVDIPGAWVLYINGRLADSFGDTETGRYTLDTGRVVRAPESGRQEGELRTALRFTRRYANPNLVATAWPGVASGANTDLELRFTRERNRAVTGYIPSLFWAVANAGVAVLLFILTVSGTTRRAALLVGTLSLGEACAVIAVGLIVTRFPVSAQFFVAIYIAGRLIGGLAPFCAYSMLERTTPRIFRYILVLMCAFFAVVFGATLSPVSVAFRLNSWANIALVPAVVAMVMIHGAAYITAFFPWRRYSAAERLMLIPNLCAFLAYEYFLFVTITNPKQVAAADFIGVVATTLFNVFYGVVIALRFRRVNDEHQSLTLEMRSAREVQRKLVPDAPSVPGFRIDTAYAPAREVGGDFYQLLPGDDGSLLVVVGDVSGKGLDAAMVVAAAVGALGDLSSRAPDEVLAHMNRALTGKTRGGFVTCCAALFRADGSVEISNAGHIAPYMSGREVEIASGLPLGIFPEADYEAATFACGGHAITFVSDGVVEATNARGELLGFERLAGLSVKPAREIAKEAERWGQEDDITVVQVAYA